MQCPECWHHNDDGVLRCRGCGHKFRPLEPLGTAKMNSFEQFLSFRHMITPSLVKFLYFAGALLITIGGVVAIFWPEHGPKDLPGGQPGAVGVLIFGNLLWRMLCELAILLFSIHEVLVNLETKADSFLRLHDTDPM